MRVFLNCISATAPSLSHTYDCHCAEFRLTLIIFTDQPQSSQSAIQEQTAAQNTAGTEESDRTVVPGSQSDRDGEADQTEEVTAVSQKDRTFLRVPSRSSSNKVQPSPTSTGLSGVTANDTRTSLGGRSKESNQSGLERRRDGSAGSSKMSISQPGQSTGAQNPQPSPHVTPKPPKKRFLSFLNCCSAPDDANTPDTDEGKLEANKVTKAPIPGRPVTASTPEALRVEQQTSQGGQFTNEKLPLPADSAQDLKAAATKAQPGGDGQPGTDGAVASPTVNVSEPPLPELPKEAESTSAGPSKEESAQTVVLQDGPADSRGQAEKLAQNEASETRRDHEGDVQMEDPVPPVPEKQDVAPPATGKAVPALPPPPPSTSHPGPSSALSAPVVPEPSEPKQQYLLPPIAPRLKGRKCLVLDLDETLVHSSFKVSHPGLSGPTRTNSKIDTTSGRLHNPR